MATNDEQFEETDRERNLQQKWLGRGYLYYSETVLHEKKGFVLPEQRRDSGLQAQIRKSFANTIR